MYYYVWPEYNTHYYVWPESNTSAITPDQHPIGPYGFHVFLLGNASPVHLIVIHLINITVFCKE